jgi:hypothetical protein
MLSGQVKVLSLPLTEILNRLSGNVAVKMDCEGCEEALLFTSCETIRRAREWLIEIHPWVSADKVIQRMKECGFSSYLRFRYHNGLAVYHFVLMPQDQKS